MKRAVLLVCVLGLVACGASVPPIHFTDEWPAQPSSNYDGVTAAWTRKTTLRAAYQEVLELAVTFKAPEWRAAHALRDAEHRKLTGEARDARLAEAQAEVAGPYEAEVMVTTWDRRENDLDRGKKSVWRVVLVDDQGKEIEPLEIVKDKRPSFTLRAEFAEFGDFATAYIARFPRTTPLFGAGAHAVRLRMSSERGGVELSWAAP